MAAPLTGKTAKKAIDGDQVRRLAKLGLTQRDIADFFGCSDSVISDRFRSEFYVGVAASKVSVRGLMWARARGGSDSVLLRLDERYFGPVGRQLPGDDSEVLEALQDDNDSISAGVDQGQASGQVDPIEE